MAMAFLLLPYYSPHPPFSYTSTSSSSPKILFFPWGSTLRLKPNNRRSGRARTKTSLATLRLISSALRPLDLTEENVRQVLGDARTELAQIFDASVGITGEAELVEIDGPAVKLSLRGRFWHKRSDVLARLGNYLKNRIPEILEVTIEDERQLDDSPENF